MRDATERLAGVAGVRAAGAINIPPFGIGNTAMRFAPAERANERGDDYLSGSWRAVTPGLFRALEIPLKAGRDFTADDDADAPEVIIVNETLARQAWPGENPVGRRLALGNSRVMTVVGVVGDTRHLVLDSLPPATMYFNHGQFPWRTMWLTVRTSGDPMSLAPVLRREVAELDPLLAVANVQPLTNLVSDTSAEPRLTMLIFGIFASAALLLAAVGLYGIISYGVAQRTREIGVTLALGAPRGRVVRRVLRDGLQLAAVGVVIGALVARWGTGILRAILYDTTPADATTYAGSCRAPPGGVGAGECGPGMARRAPGPGRGAAGGVAPAGTAASGAPGSRAPVGVAQSVARLLSRPPRFPAPGGPASRSAGPSARPPEKPLISKFYRARTRAIASWVGQ